MEKNRKKQHEFRQKEQNRHWITSIFLKCCYNNNKRKKIKLLVQNHISCILCKKKKKS